MTASSRYFKGNDARDFYPAEFPEIVAEVAALKAQLSNFKQPNAEVVIISFVKTHSVRSDYTKSHAVLIKILNAKGSCLHLENIFTARSGNLKFTNSLEVYLKNEMDAFYQQQSLVRHPTGETNSTTTSVL